MAVCGVFWLRMTCLLQGEVKIAQSDSGKKDGMDIDTDKPAKVLIFQRNSGFTVFCVFVQEPEFPALTAQQMTEGKAQYQRVQVPPHRSVYFCLFYVYCVIHCFIEKNRMAALKAQWMEIYKPIVEHMKLQIRFNPKKKCVELRVRVCVCFLVVSVLVCV